MRKLETKIDIQSEEFIENKATYQKLLNEFREKLNFVINRKSEGSVKKHIERGKLLARDRIELLIDKNTPFLELSALAANGMYDDSFPSAGIITGIGIVHGNECMIVANDATVKGGTYIKETIKKHIRAQEIAMENHFAMYLYG